MGKKSGGKLISAALDFIKKAKGQRVSRRTQNKMDPEKLEHMLMGEIKPGANRGSGYHHRPGGNDFDDRRIKPDSKKMLGDKGVYSAEPEFFDKTMPPPPGQWKPKSGPGGTSAFFPDDWDAGKIDKSVTEAFKNSKTHPTDPNRWLGEVDGVKISGYYDNSVPQGFTHGFPDNVQ
ncbi:EndoU domain-containing protein [Glycomyces tritici]|uniref:EndoU domain-containing protein n=1 Tax=Glycomyces tritici TaxID=2665176 RepID=A0ABT7YYZ0_9ACTN|nr:EndoU domain-containing protein [Glycomyces tritici]MDN3243833.1 EndoU domain-containing protein [Glycomyces tritici]